MCATHHGKRPRARSACTCRKRIWQWLSKQCQKKAGYVSEDTSARLYAEVQMPVCVSLDCVKSGHEVWFCTSKHKLRFSCKQHNRYRDVWVEVKGNPRSTRCAALQKSSLTCVHAIKQILRMHLFWQIWLTWIDHKGWKTSKLVCTPSQKMYSFWTKNNKDCRPRKKYLH